MTVAVSGAVTSSELSVVAVMLQCGKVGQKRLIKKATLWLYYMGTA
jgi:hypothetical protein